MKIYKVTWEMDIEAESYEEAAQEALEIQRDPESIATVFNVKILGPNEPNVTVDLWDV